MITLHLSAGAGVGSSQKGILRVIVQGRAKRVVIGTPDKDAVPPTSAESAPASGQLRDGTAIALRVAHDASRYLLDAAQPAHASCPMTAQRRPQNVRPHYPLQLPPNCVERTAERVGTMVVIIGATSTGKTSWSRPRTGG
jgi:hypothetical protein